MALIEFQDYSFEYINGEIPALRDVSVKVGAGEVILIAGDSGSGKSTFVKSVNGLIPNIIEGEIKGKRYIKANDAENMPIYEISEIIGSVFQSPRSQFFTLNSESELVFAMENYGFSKKDMQLRIKELSGILPIGNLMDKDIFKLSSGERQLLALASAMVLRPDILLFDEPSANLDYGNSMKLKKIILKLKEAGKTVLVADHRFFYLNGIIDRVLLIQDGRLTIYNSENEFKSSRYNTRNFNLFDSDIPFKERTESGEIIASINNVNKKGILEGIDLEFSTGEVTTIIGSNGAGKTTLAKLLTNSIKPDGGEIWTESMPFYVMQDVDYQLFGTSVSSELEIGNEGIDAEDKDKVLAELEILKYRDTHPFDLSGGEKQRLQIAMATLSEAKILIFDEPTSGLDIKSMNRVVGEVTKLAKEKAVIIISHDYEFIRKVSDRIVYLKEGSVQKDFILCEETLEELNNAFFEMGGER